MLATFCVKVQNVFFKRSLCKPCRSKMNRYLKLLLVCCFIFLLSGCTNTETITGGIRVTFQLWIGIAAIVGGLLVATFGWFIRANNFRGWAICVSALIATVVIGPNTLFDHVTVTEEKFSTRGGLWFWPKIHEFEFEDIRSLGVTEEKKRYKGRQQNSYFMEFHLKSGKTVKLYATNALMKQATEAIMENLQSRKIPIVNQIPRR